MMYIFVRSVPWYSTIRGDTPIHRGESRTRREVDMPRARQEGAVYLAKGSEGKLHVKTIYLWRIYSTMHRSMRCLSIQPGCPGFQFHRHFGFDFHRIHFSNKIDHSKLCMYVCMYVVCTYVWWLSFFRFRNERGEEEKRKHAKRKRKWAKQRGAEGRNKTRKIKTWEGRKRIVINRDWRRDNLKKLKDY